MLKVDFEKWTYPMENAIFVKNQIFKKISNICFFLNAVQQTASYQTNRNYSAILATLPIIFKKNRVLPRNFKI
jgi:hypothetical protein